ncbi:hypothetical protein [Acidovorax soli]|uniref:hypothetical protein n=1 Tax=Acidovorax soli TaxID=592050 RepID=UPI0032B267A2
MTVAAAGAAAFAATAAAGIAGAAGTTALAAAGADGLTGAAGAAVWANTAPAKTVLNAIRINDFFMGAFKKARNYVRLLLTPPHFMG